MNDKSIFLTAQCSDISIDSISNAIIKCLEHPYYSVGVYISTRVEMDEVLKTFISEWRHVLSIYLTEAMNYRCTARSYGFMWQFPNGSVIRIMISRENVRGFRFNLALISDSLSRDYIRNVIFPCVRDYNVFDSEYHIINEYNKRKQNTDFINEDALDCEDNHELDEFINSFKINKNT